MNTAVKKTTPKSELPTYKKCFGFSSPNYTNVPDEFLDYYVAYLSESELKVSLYIIRRTFGFKKDSDSISLNQLEKGIVKKDGTVLDYGTRLSRPSIVKAIKGLIEKGIIESSKNKSQSGGDTPTTYRLHMKVNNEEGVKIFNPPSKKSLPQGVKNFNPQETVKQKTVRQKNTISNKENLKIENGEEETRGGGFKSFDQILAGRKLRGGANKTMPVKPSSEVETIQPSQGDNLSFQKNMPLKTLLQPPIERTRLDDELTKISSKIRDRGIIAQCKNFFFNRLRQKGVSENQFIETLRNVLGLTLDIIPLLDKPGAYFYAVLCQRWNIV